MKRGSAHAQILPRDLWTQSGLEVAVENLAPFSASSPSPEPKKQQYRFEQRSHRLGVRYDLPSLFRCRIDDVPRLRLRITQESFLSLNGQAAHSGRTISAEPYVHIVLEIA